MIGWYEVASATHFSKYIKYISARKNLRSWEI